jgi:hypothetical protein
VISQKALRNIFNACHVTKSFWGIHKAENYHEIVSDLLTAYKAIGCNMSLKVNFVDSHLEISSGHFQHGKAVPGQVEPQYAG